MKTNLMQYFAVATFAMSSFAAYAAADHLVLSEVGISLAIQDAEMSAEYVEIFNPTATAVSLDQYYLSDDHKYSLLPTGAQGVGSSDNIVQFPTGSMLQPGQVAVVCGGAVNFLTEFFGSDMSKFSSLPGTNPPLLFEVGDTDPTVDNMTSFNTNGTHPKAFSFTNSGEFMVLFHWDGATDLVQDVDMVTWGNVASGDNMFGPKTTSSTGANGTTYLADAGTHANLNVGPPDIIISRVSIDEPSEVTTGGNGLGGHDESTEVCASSWVGLEYGFGQSPGMVNLGLSGQNQPPTVNSVERDIQNPDTNDNVTITANVTDTDGTIDHVTVYVTTDLVSYSIILTTPGTGGDFTAQLNTHNEGDLVSYHVEAVDNSGAFSYYPPLASDLLSFNVSDNPVAPGDLVINEVLANDPGGSAEYEFIELKNRTNAPINLADYRVSDSHRYYYIIPPGNVIPANGFGVLTVNPASLTSVFTTIPGSVPVVDWGNFGLNNGGDDIALVAPNDFLFNGVTTFVDQVIYGDTGAGWPAQATGQSLELKNPSYDNTNPSNWLACTASTPPTAGTPGARNSVFEAGASVNDWNLY